ncbi:2-oxo acid dehydrogenase subunit E2 [Williamsia sp. R60]
MAQQIVLPKLGLTMQEGVIGEWLAGEGQHIAVGDLLLRLETDKVEVDVEAEAEGILATGASAGDVLPVGAVIGWLLGEGESAPDGTAAVAQQEPVAETRTAPASVVVGGPDDGGRIKSSPNARRVAVAANVDLSTIRGTGPGGRIVSEDVEEHLAAAPAKAPEPTAATPTIGKTTQTTGAAGQFVGPLVRRRADELRVDLAAVAGTGIGGRITTADVEAAGTVAAPAALGVGSPTTGPQAGEVIPLTGMRGAIARNMIDSLQTMAQLTHSYEVDVTALVAVREQLKAEAAQSGSKAPSLNDFVVKAAALALREHPLLNAGIADDKITLFEEINVGVAVAVDGGLIVPVVRDADSLSVAEVADRTRTLASGARTGKLGLSDMEGATFSVSTLGAYGVDFFTPVINPGNVAILGVGRVKDGFRWEGETPARTQVMTLSLTFDHRAVDGAPAAEYLKTLSAILGRPLSLLAGR